MATQTERFIPIIYVRGYAMTQGEINETTADPFCGFNLGSTTYRATPDKNRPARKFIFESPLVRLAAGFGYSDVYEEGLDIIDPEWTGSIPRKSVVIYRYYEDASTILGQGQTPKIEEFAKGLARLVIRVRDLVCLDPANGVSPEEFRCNLVAHSMGGLVCRAFLQNPALGPDEARRSIAKVFTYATPHNGIDVAGINVPAWLDANDINNFNRDRMSEYLNLKDLYTKTGRVDWIPEQYFPSENFFCMIGTNRADYEVASGLSRAFSGHGSDGLVKIENASVWGINDHGQVSKPCATAYTYRSHSGFFGIVNSEEAYQNLIRFFFGDVRVDIWLEVDEIRLPAEVQKEADKHNEIDGLYQFEILASPRGKRWYLTRRMTEEDSVACRSHKELTDTVNTGARTVYLSSIFLGNAWRVKQERSSLAYSLTLGVRVPDYEVNRKFWPNEHYEGGYLFRDSAVIEMIVPESPGEAWQIAYDWQSDNLGKASTSLAPDALQNGQAEITIPFDSASTPGIRGRLRFILKPWNS
jgi:pimeloyl-ACP methyl ester carboxylesterase